MFGIQQMLRLPRSPYKRGYAEAVPGGVLFKVTHFDEDRNLEFLVQGIQHGTIVGAMLDYFQYNFSFKMAGMIFFAADKHVDGESVVHLANDFEKEFGTVASELLAVSFLKRVGSWPEPDTEPNFSAIIIRDFKEARDKFLLSAPANILRPGLPAAVAVGKVNRATSKDASGAWNPDGHRLDKSVFFPLSNDEIKIYEGSGPFFYGKSLPYQIRNYCVSEFNWTRSPGAESVFERLLEEANREAVVRLHGVDNVTYEFICVLFKAKVGANQELRALYANDPVVLSKLDAALEASKKLTFEDKMRALNSQLVYIDGEVDGLGGSVTGLFGNRTLTRPGRLPVVATEPAAA